MPSQVSQLEMQLKAIELADIGVDIDAVDEYFKHKEAIGYCAFDS